jgi:hypothetical protein
MTSILELTIERYVHRFGEPRRLSAPLQFLGGSRMAAAVSFVSPVDMRRMCVLHLFCVNF